MLCHERLQVAALRRLRRAFWSGDAGRLLRWDQLWRLYSGLLHDLRD